MKTFENKFLSILASIVRVLLGCFFIISAWAKLRGMDNFEIYVFSYNILSLKLSFLAARLVIVVELLIGAGLISHVWKKFVDIATLLALVFFTCFLGYAAIIGRTDSCQCMGQLIEMNPLQSILKNAVLLLVLLFAMKAHEWSWRPKWFIWIPVIIAPFVYVFVRSAPDNWLYPAGEELYDHEYFEKAMSPEGDLAGLNLQDGRHLVAFLSPTCHLCQMANDKMTHIYRRNDLDSTRFLYITYAQDTNIASLTPDDTSFSRLSYMVSPKTFAYITYGQRPMVFLIEDSKVIYTFNYRNIDESTIVKFFKQEGKFDVPASNETESKQ